LGVGSDKVTVESKTIPEFDISYFFTPNIAAELILTVPQEHDVRLQGSKIGTFKHLPPVLSIQYHCTPQSSFSPYVGVGINYTRIFDVHLANNSLKLEQDSIGPSLQVGFDYKLDKHWLVNLDVKKVYIRSDVRDRQTNSKLTQVKLDPWLFGLGVGYRF